MGQKNGCFYRAPKVNFQRIKTICHQCISDLVFLYLPRGKQQGEEWVCLNPNRADRKLGSFKVNLRTGLWADFATNARGADMISLVAFVKNCSQTEAAIKLANQIGVDYET